MSSVQYLVQCTPQRVFVFGSGQNQNDKLRGAKFGFQGPDGMKFYTLYLLHILYLKRPFSILNCPFYLTLT